ncbi:hypothetical protein BCR33DRAFT_848736 [Rhizoclosmatium globosum]|uniref:Uncharacterized protein n=1 Tax=Rhizoclosmatium globosum TaxID=329046 RepID=A0A1Y2CK97_9FUNG|nr:hypothetical protein BCR33DRAFT_848736 [Rhizoclosmatium globosum]|eukprot:ORY47387.1 hypothetical protein BCR33DRAFT_848736 [Rhizoclosmatium globosum]
MPPQDSCITMSSSSTQNPAGSTSGSSSGSSSASTSSPSLPTNSEQPETTPFSFYVPEECVNHQPIENIYNLTLCFTSHNVDKPNNKKKYISDIEKTSWFRNNTSIFDSSTLRKGTKVPDQLTTSPEILSRVLHYLYGSAHMHNFTVNKIVRQERKISDLERQVGALEESLQIMKVGEPKKPGLLSGMGGTFGKYAGKQTQAQPTDDSLGTPLPKASHPRTSPPSDEAKKKNKFMDMFKGKARELPLDSGPSTAEFNAAPPHQTFKFDRLIDRKQLFFGVSEVAANMAPEHTKFLSSRQTARKCCEPAYQRITQKNPSTFTVIAKLTYHSNSSETNTLSRLRHCEQAIWFDGHLPGSGYRLVPTDYNTADLQYVDSKLVETLFQAEQSALKDAKKGILLLDFDSTILVSEREVGDLSVYPDERRRDYGEGVGEVVLASGLIDWLLETSKYFQIIGVTSTSNERARGIKNALNFEAGADVITDVFSTFSQYHFMTTADKIKHPRCKSVFTCLLEWLQYVVIVDDNLRAWIQQQEERIGIHVPSVALGELWDVDLARITARLMFLHTHYFSENPVSFGESLRKFGREG